MKNLGIDAEMEANEKKVTWCPHEGANKVSKMFIKLCNLGHDAEVRYTNNGKAVASLALAYSVGYGQNKKTQWIEGSLWGERAQKIAQYLTKGTKILLTADDLEVEFYQKCDGSQGCKLKCRVVDIEFAGSQHQQGNGSQQQWQSQQPIQQQQPTDSYAQVRQRSIPQYNGAPDFDDDIPF